MNDKSEGEAPIRENMVNTAVHFLQNPAVQTSPLSQKKAFLFKKGLTEEEINRALEKAAIPNSFDGTQVKDLVYSQPMYQPSMWTLINRYGSAIVIFGIAMYGLHRFYQLYIAPLIYGEEKRKSQVTITEAQLLEVNRTLAQLRKSVATIEQNLEIQKREMDDFLKAKSLESECLSPSVFIDIRSDIATVKSLLLNRRQFPDVPKINPCIPTWQLNGKADKNEKLTLDKSCEEDNDDGGQIIINNDPNDDSSHIKHNSESVPSTESPFSDSEEKEQEAKVEHVPTNNVAFDK